MTFEKLKNLKSYNQTIKLINSDNFAFSLSFFYLVFVQNSKITLKHNEIHSFLDDYIFTLNESYPMSFPKEAKEYLDDFCNEKNGYLRKYHLSDDEAIYELTPHTQKALEFIESLEKKEFIGSRSKFNIIFELLEELEFETQLSDEERIAELESQKRELDRQISAIKAKNDIRFDSSRIKEHYLQLEEMVRKLKYDFSEIEYNFRTLNTTAMQQIALSSESKGETLESIFNIEDEIRESDQGKSFFAFWQLLTDMDKSERLSTLIDNLYNIESVKSLDNDKKLQNLQYTFLKSGEKVYDVSAKLIEQLRRFLDDRVLIENRRILDLCKVIEKSAIEIKEYQPSQRVFSTIQSDKVTISSIFSKSLYRIKEDVVFKKELKESEIELDMQSFYELFYIDEEILKTAIDKSLQKCKQASLVEILDDFPIQKGISELVAYISIAKESDNVMIEESIKEHIVVKNSEGITQNVSLPKIVFVRK